MKQVFACAVTIVFLGAAALSAKGEEGGEYGQRKTIYQEKCQMCHGEDGKGDGIMSSAFSTPPADFTKSEFWKNNPEQKIREAIENGYKLMPRIDLAPSQIKKIIEYLSHAFKR